MQTGAASHLNPVQAFFQSWSNWWKRLARVASLDRMGATEAQGVARDLGTSVAELRMLAAQGESSADLLQRRLLDVKIDPATVELAVMRDMQRCCSLCGDKVLCQHELEDRPRSAEWPKYCPNEQTIDALRADKNRS